MGNWKWLSFPKIINQKRRLFKLITFDINHQRLLMGGQTVVPAPGGILRGRQCQVFTSARKNCRSGADLCTNRFKCNK